MFYEFMPNHAGAHGGGGMGHPLRGSTHHGGSPKRPQPSQGKIRDPSRDPQKFNVKN